MSHVKAILSGKERRYIKNDEQLYHCPYGRNCEWCTAGRQHRNKKAIAAAKQRESGIAYQE